MSAGSNDPLTTSFAALRDKRSLAAIVRDAGRLSVHDSVDLVLDVCDELANAHANGIVHGDLGLHRVRTFWPRNPGDVVEIFALDADDTGAIDFRAAFQTPAQAPEQRAGRIGDQRSDIWAVGAILHALVGGQPPTKRPVREVLTGAPHALIACVEQCLAENPAARPQTVDDVAAALASFASFPPERFQQLARRRLATMKAKHVNEKVSALGKLDDAAVKRESGDRIFAVASLSSVSPMPVAPVVMEPPPPTAKHSYDDISVAFEWPQIHGAPSTSIAMGQGPCETDAPTAAAPRETLPPIAPAPIPREVARQTTQPLTQEQAFGPLGQSRPPEPPTLAAPPRQPRNTSPMFHPWLQHPSMAPPPVNDAPVRDQSHFRAAPARHASAHSASAFRAAPMTGSHSMFPAAQPVYPGTVTNLPAHYPGTATHIATANLPAQHYAATHLAPAPQVYRQPSQPSYHPPSFGPVVLDSADNAIHIPAAPRVPQLLSELEEYRQAKRESRRAATFAVLVAAAVLVLGFGFGSRMLARDRAAMHAAEANQNQVAATQPPAAVTALPVAKNAEPIKAPEVVAPTPISALPTATPAATTTPVVKTKRHHSHSASTTASTTTPAPTASQDDRPDTAPTNALSDALGKKEAAPSNALDAALK